MNIDPFNSHWYSSSLVVLLLIHLLHMNATLLTVQPVSKRENGRNSMEREKRL